MALAMADWDLLCRRRVPGTANLPRRDGEETEDGFLNETLMK